MTSSEDLAWLAGLWDGEGSIGIFQSRGTWIIAVQMSMTHMPTIERTTEILNSKGVTVRGPYTYKEKKAHHKPAVIIRITGLGNIQKMAGLLVPYSVTKKRLWELALEWCGRRIELGGGLNERGHVRHRSAARYDEDDLRVVEAIRRANDSRRNPRRGKSSDGAGGLDAALVASGEDGSLGAH